MNTAKDFMIADYIEHIKHQIATQIATRILQHHLGLYVLEEGEIIDYEWSAKDTQVIISDDEEPQVIISDDE